MLKMGEYLTSNDSSPHLNMVGLSDAFLRIPTFICIYLYNSTLLSLNMKKKQNLTDGKCAGEVGRIHEVFAWDSQ